MLYSATQSSLQYTVLGILGLCTLPVLSSPVTPALTARSASSASDDGISSQVLATNGVGMFPFYRIVGLANLGQGVLLAAFDGRPNGNDSPAPNSILQRRSVDGGKTWGETTYISKGQPGNTTAGLQQYGFSDPSYVIDNLTGTVFNFHVFSKNQGFAGSVIGNDDTDLNVISSEVSISTDQGLTWSTDPENQPYLPPVASQTPGAPPLLTSVVKPLGTTVNGVANVGGVTGMFAASGEGIQLRYGPHAGRLIQQFVGNIIQADGSIAIQAYSVYSDDSGKTWQMGTPVGVDMDENKVVELSNGNVMLNSRPSGDIYYRQVAISTDGGETYSSPWIETQLPDPQNNGAITRMYPDAPENSTEAAILLFTNADSQVDRVNGTIRYSCDDGTTWSSGRPFHSSDTSYSTVTALGDDTFGIFYEGTNNTLVFDIVDKAWIGVSC